MFIGKYRSTKGTISIDNGKIYMNACEIASSLGQLLAMTVNKE